MKLGVASPLIRKGGFSLGFLSSFWPLQFQILATSGRARALQSPPYAPLGLESPADFPYQIFSLLSAIFALMVKP